MVALKTVLFRLRNRHLYDDRRQRRQMQEEAQRFEGKRVALVGNAQSIFDRSDGQLIDDHDVVVRLNWGGVRQPESQGQRTDILCLACSLTEAEWRDMFGSPPVIWVTPVRHLLTKDMVRHVDFCYPLSQWELLSRNMLGGNRPSAGLISLHMLRAFAPISISLFGFDWKRTKTFYNSKENDWLHSHAWEQEQKLIASWPELIIH